MPEATPAEPALPEHVERYLDEHFVPEPPPPLPKLHGITILAWALIGLGILAIVFHNAIPADFAQGSNYLAAAPSSAASSPWSTACATTTTTTTETARSCDRSHRAAPDGVRRFPAARSSVDRSPLTR